MSTSPLFILYGSATGNAEHIAKDLAASYEAISGNPDADSFFSSVICCELDQYKKKCQSIWDTEPEAAQAKHGVLVVTSTTGNGDAPENASRFVRFIKRKTTADTQPFRNCAFAVLALGDTNYDQFCNTGKVVDKKVAELGGTRAAPLCCADEATGLEDMVDPWTSSIFTKITIACRKEGAAQTTSSGASTKATDASVADSAEEEKKTETADDIMPTNATTTAPESSTSVGVSTVRALLEKQAASTIMESSPSPGTLPSLSANRLSSFALVDDNAENDVNGRPYVGSVSSVSSGGLHYTFQHPFAAPVKSARYLTKTSVVDDQKLTPPSSITQTTASIHEQYPLNGEAAERNGKRVVEIELGLPDEFFDYAPGDAIGMVVENSEEDVSYVLDQLKQHHGLLPNQKMSLDTNSPVTLEDAIKRQIDLTWFPLKNKRILYSLSQQALGEEARVLEWLSSTTGETVYDKYIVEQRRGVVDLMKDFPSLQMMPVQALLGILPALAPRYYSITSSPLVSRSSLTIALAVVDYLTPSLMVDGREAGCRRIGGLASQFLESLVTPLLLKKSTTSATVQVFPKPTGEFRLPSSLATPLILIGPGTGVAPFVGFLQHRRALVQGNDAQDAAGTVVEGTWRGGMDMDEEALTKETQGLRLAVDHRQANGGSPVGSSDVFFGCRHSDHDFLYQGELEDLKTDVLSRLHTAFSREGAEKVYVQDLMAQQASHLQNLILKENASIYICGDGNHMAKAVQGSIQLILEKELGATDATEYIKQMKADKRLLLDIWS